MNNLNGIGWKAKCILCDDADGKTWETVSFMHDAKEVVRDRLWEHMEETHLDVIMEVWMNNQCSNSYEKVNKERTGGQQQ